MPLSESTGLGRRTVLKHLNDLHLAGKIRRTKSLSDMRAVAILPKEGKIRTSSARKENPHG